MSLYRKVSVAIWEGDFAAKATGDGELWTVCHYLLTSRHNQLGIGLYRLPLVFIADATGFALETCRRCVEDASETGFARYDEARKTVFVVEQARHEWGESPNIKRNDVAGLIKGLPEVFFDLRKSFLLKEFCDRYEKKWRDVFGALETHPRRVWDASRGRARAKQDQDQEAGDRKEEEDSSELVADDDSKPAPAIWIPIHAGKQKAPEGVQIRTEAGSTEAGITGKQLEEYAEAYGMDSDRVFAELKKARQWCISNPRKQKTPREVMAFLNRWMDKAVNGTRPESRAVRQLQATAAPTDEPRLDLRARLENLAAALPANLADREAVAERILSLEGDAKEVELALAELDREVIRQVTNALQSSDVEEIEREVASASAFMTERLPVTEAERARDRLREGIMRRRLKLPVLSIFSSEATPE